MSKKHPKTFKVPSKVKLASIKSGSFVKVCHNNERFWVEIIGISPDHMKNNNEIGGIIDNELVCKQPFKFGDLIRFHKENIFDIMK